MYFKSKSDGQAPKPYGNFALTLAAMAEMSDEQVKALGEKIDWNEPAMGVSYYQEKKDYPVRGMLSASLPMLQLIRTQDRRLIDLLMTPERLDRKVFVDWQRLPLDGREGWEGALLEAYRLGDWRSAEKILEFDGQLNLDLGRRCLSTLDFRERGCLDLLASALGVPPEDAGKCIDIAVREQVEMHKSLLGVKGDKEEKRMRLDCERRVNEWLMVKATAAGNLPLFKLLDARGARPGFLACLGSTERFAPELTELALSRARANFTEAEWKASRESSREERSRRGECKTLAEAAAKALSWGIGGAMESKRWSDAGERNWTMERYKENLPALRSFALWMVRDGLWEPGDEPNSHKGAIVEILAPWAGELGAAWRKEVAKQVPVPTPKEAADNWARKPDDWFFSRLKAASGKWSDEDRETFASEFEAALAESQPKGDSSSSMGNRTPRGCMGDEDILNAFVKICLESPERLASGAVIPRLPVKGRR